MTKYTTHFAYDPQGNQRISSDVHIKEYKAGQGYYQLDRHNYTTVHTPAGVMMIRKRWGDMTYGNNFLGISWFDYRYNSYGGLKEVKDDQGTTKRVTNNSETKTQLFSYWDGLDVETWAVYQPFNLIPDTGGNVPLAAPTEAISDRLGITPADVDEPLQGLPAVGGEVLPPVEDEETTEVTAPTEEPTSEPSADGTTEGQTNGDGLATLSELSPRTQLA
jgi:hypothetical protein